jgi:undecaprenyl-diphosphatase
MTLFQAIFLGIVQGLTEFLPVSSSGHLALLQRLFTTKEAPVTFVIVVHLATLGAVIVYFRHKLWALVVETAKALRERNFAKVPREVWLLFVGTIPVVILGSLLKPVFEQIFTSMLFVGTGFLVTSGLMLGTKLLGKTSKNLDKVSLRTALVIGVFQAVAIFPGISRSGATIFGGLREGIKKEDAFEFSFLLSIPAILGAVLFDFDQVTKLAVDDGLGLGLGFLAAFISGYWALGALRKLVLGAKLHWFGVYCLGASVVSFVIAVWSGV